MPVNSNRAIESARGELVKILYMDDYFTDKNSLQIIVNAFTPSTKWLVTGCLHNDGYEEKNPHEPYYSPDIFKGKNTIGSPSVLTMRKESAIYFDPKLSFMLDCDLYKRLHKLYGEPTIVRTPNVVIGIHEGQTSHLMPAYDKQWEIDYTIKKHT